MVAQILDGIKAAKTLRLQIAERISARKLTPGLAVVLIGEDPASQVYVRNKGKAAEEVGMKSFTHRLPSSTSENDLLDLVNKLNADPDVHGILVQLPLPAQIDAQAIISAVDPRKDVDGFHPINAGRLSLGLPSFVPCTPQGCMRLLRLADRDLKGLNAVVLGRSNIVGKPMMQLLLQADCTVTIAHSKTKDLPAICRKADILVAAIGKPGFVKGDWVQPGALVCDVGINRMTDTDGKSRLIGDVDFAAARDVAGAITPVPGGVGPMTIACLLKNTYEASAGEVL